MRLIRRSDLPARLWPETSSLFEDIFNVPMFTSVAKSAERFVPPVDILEKDGNLILRVEVPGINEKDIDLKLEGNMLTLKGEKKIENESDRGNYHRLESFYGTFTRSFTLPETVDREKIKAECKNGLLTVTIPQKPEVRAREIPVSAS